MLSDRLQHIYDLVPVTKVLADIGTDHGYLPIALVKEGKVDKAYAMDINEGPLEKAATNIKDAKVDASVTTILSDGLAHLPSDVNTVVIAGMGGMLMSRLLESEKDKLEALDCLVLSPHLDEDCVRRKVMTLGFVIEDEAMVVDNNKYYTVMVCRKGSEQWSDLEIRYSRRLMEARRPVWLTFMKKNADKCRYIIGRLEAQSSQVSRKRLREVQNELEEIEAVLRDDSK